MRPPAIQTLIAGFETSTLRIYKDGYNSNGLNLRVKTGFINTTDQFSIVCNQETITIKRHGLHYEGKTLKPNFNNGIWQLYFKSDIVPIGHYEFDEDESDTDNLVCYWSEQI